MSRNKRKEKTKPMFFETQHGGLSLIIDGQPVKPPPQVRRPRVTETEKDEARRRSEEAREKAIRGRGGERVE